jgi:nicotinate-nucleotide pyrophosphorylase (carboxylating)
MLTPTPHLDALLDLALAEDIGCGDATGAALIPADATATFEIQARQDLIFCGAPAADRLLWRFGPGAPTSTWHVEEGARVKRGTVLGHLTGNTQTLLIIERPLLNLLQRMSGVATLTRRYVDAVAGTSAKVIDTRKTLPGWRMLDKYATRMGGAGNHRAALDGGILIKDNHLQAAGGITAALNKARAHAPHSLRLEIEVEDLAGLDEAVAAGADVVLIDNFTPEQARIAVERHGKNAIIEASGGITLDTIRAFAETGVHLIAVGALTHSAVAVDIAAEVAPT